MQVVLRVLLLLSATVLTGTVALQAQTRADCEANCSALWQPTIDGLTQAQQLCYMGVATQYGACINQAQSALYDCYEILCEWDCSWCYFPYYENLAYCQGDAGYGNGQCASIGDFIRQAQDNLYICKAGCVGYSSPNKQKPRETLWRRDQLGLPLPEIGVPK